MERSFKPFWILSLSTLVLSSPAYASNNMWDGLIKRISGNSSKVLKLTAGHETKPYYKVTPKVVSFKGEVEIPSVIYLTSGSGIVHESAAQIIIDGQVVCNYSPKSNHHLVNRGYVFKNCNDGSHSKDRAYVNSKIELKLNYASSERAALLANVRVLSSEEVQYGLVFPYINPSEGQILMFNGEAWVPADASSLGGIGEPGPMGPQGLQGPQGEQGPVGPQGPKGDQGIAGVAGEKGDKGDKGEKGDPGVAGPAGATGATGPQGPVGPMGPKGADGSIGAVGPMGPQGPVGPAGAVGPMGPQGPKGADGAVGAVGPQGPKGDQGVQGPAGQDGAQGPQGPAGPMGLAGAQGPQGPVGPAGAQGPQGEAGPQGIQGEKGEKGDKGDRGLSEIAYMRDQKPSGAHGGTCTAGQWMTRSLNTLGGDTNFISLSNNRFVLQPGTYFVEIVAPGHGVNQHQAKLKVIETNTDVLYGTNVSSFANAPTTALSVIMGEIVVSVASTFEIQQRCAGSRADLGFGIAANFGSPEIYTQVKIIKKQ